MTDATDHSIEGGGHEPTVENIEREHLQHRPSQLVILSESA